MRLIGCCLIIITVIQIVYASSHRSKRQNRFGRQWSRQNQVDHGGFNQGGFNQGGFNQGGFNQGGFNQGGFDQDYDYDQFGQNQNQNQFFQNQNQQQQQQQQQQQPPTTQAPASGSPSRAFLSCMSGCQALSHYNPVCGSDGQTYHNDQRLGCAQRCGASVQQATIGACPNPNIG